MPVLPRQIAALPLTLSPDGTLDVFLVTSRGSGRWIIPKGNPIRGLSPHEVAAREALEEAGLVGRVQPRCVGSFRFERLRRRAGEACLIDVYPLHVERQLRNYEEKGQRIVQRCDLHTACALVESPHLGEIMMQYALQFELGVRGVA